MASELEVMMDILRRSRDDMERVDMSALKKASWDNAHEICNFWVGQTVFMEKAYKDLYNGIDSEVVRIASKNLRLEGESNE